MKPEKNASEVSPKQMIAATIWLLVSEEQKMPIEMYIAPTRKAPT